ncbi:ynaI [Symbiodinium sp. CCMP2592]|nr:ynaI [Symbiodinium sp. CCMP2592]
MHRHSYACGEASLQGQADKIDSSGRGSAGAGDDVKKGAEAEIMKKVATRLQDFESLITSQLSTFATDFEKKLFHVYRSIGAMKPIDGAGAGDTGLDTMAEDVDQLKFDVGELQNLLTNSKGEVSQTNRIVLACERNMEDFKAAMDAVNVDLAEMRARVDATHSITTCRQRVEATMTAEISTMHLDSCDIQEALKNHDSWMEGMSNTLQQMQEKEENWSEDMINLKNELTAKLDTKVDNVAWKEATDELDAAVKTIYGLVSALRLDADANRRKGDETLANVRHDITAVETNLEESKSKLAMDTDHAINALNGRIDFTNKDLAATQDSLHTTQKSLSDCFHEVAVVRSDVERNVADIEELALTREPLVRHAVSPELLAKATGSALQLQALQLDFLLFRLATVEDHLAAKESTSQPAASADSPKRLERTSQAWMATGADQLSVPHRSFVYVKTATASDNGWIHAELADDEATAGWLPLGVLEQLEEGQRWMRTKAKWEARDESQCSAEIGDFCLVWVDLLTQEPSECCSCCICCKSIGRSSNRKTTSHAM